MSLALKDTRLLAMAGNTKISERAEAWLVQEEGQDYSDIDSDINDAIKRRSQSCEVYNLFKDVGWKQGLPPVDGDYWVVLTGPAGNAVHPSIARFASDTRTLTFLTKKSSTTRWKITPQAENSLWYNPVIVPGEIILPSKENETYDW